MTTRETVRALRACDEDEWGEIVESAVEAATARLAAENERLINQLARHAAEFAGLRIAMETENERLREAIEWAINALDGGDPPADGSIARQMLVAALETSAR